jgi:hypothetical protein
MTTTKELLCRIEKWVKMYVVTEKGRECIKNE